MENSFRFGLQKLLDIRMEKEEESKRVYMDAQSDKNKTERKLIELKESYKKYNLSYEKETVVDKKIRRNYLSALSISMDETETSLKKKEAILNHCREDLKNKQMERKTVEVIKDKRYIEFLKEQNLIEQRLNDEFALYSHIRKVTEGR